MNWINFISHKVVKEWNVIVIPSDILLYRGVDVNIQDNFLKDEDTWLTSLNPAFWYAFSSDSGIKGEFGKVITIETLDNIYILDISKKSNLEKIRENAHIPIVGDTDIITYLYNDGERRTSIAYYDNIFLDFMKSLMP